MNSYSREVVRPRFSAVLVLGIVAFGATTSLAQSVTITVQVRPPDGEFRKGLRIRAVPKFPGWKSESSLLERKHFNSTKKFFEITFRDLPTGDYEFVVCDALAYIPETKMRSVSPDTASSPVEIRLIDQTKGAAKKSSPPLLGPDGVTVGRDVPAFLKDAATGCTVKQGQTDRNGIAEFDHLPPGKYEVDDKEADRDP